MRRSARSGLLCLFALWLQLVAPAFAAPAAFDAAGPICSRASPAAPGRPRRHDHRGVPCPFCQAGHAALPLRDAAGGFAPLRVAALVPPALPQRSPTPPPAALRAAQPRGPPAAS